MIKMLSIPKVRRCLDLPASQKIQVVGIQSSKPIQVFQQAKFLDNFDKLLLGSRKCLSKLKLAKIKNLCNFETERKNKTRKTQFLSTSIYDLVLLVLLDVCHFHHHVTHTFLSNHTDSSVLSRLSRYSCLYRVTQIKIYFFNQLCL